MSAPTAPSSQSDSAAAPVAYDREQNFDAFDVGSSGINRRPHINVDITANASEEADFEAAKSVIGNLSFSSRATAPLPKSLLKHSRLTAHLGDVNEQHHPQEGSEDKAGDQHSAPTLTTGSISATTRSSLRSSMRRRADNEPPAFTAPSLSAVAEVPRGDSARRRDEPAAASSAPDTRAHSLPPNITFRAAVPSDAPAILETHMASVKGRSMRQMYTEEEIGWWTANRTAESYAEKIVEPNRLWLIAVCSEANLPAVAAFADLSIQNLIPNAPIDAPLPSVYTNGFYVHPAFQGKSVGHCLLEAAESAALKQIIASLSPPVRSQPALKIDFSLHSTLVAVGFYERFQYTPVEKCKHQFVGGGAVSCIKMIKSVDVPPLS